jgi:transcriptional repressor NrdR
MLCPLCKSENLKVLESRDTENGYSVRRRRECDDCKHRFTTFERIETTNFLVIKKDGSREPYARSKIEHGVHIACGKRQVTQEQIETLINTLEQKWISLGKEIESATLGYDVMEGLKSLDDIAYIRFASVYRNFKDIDTLKKELLEIL